MSKYSALDVQIQATFDAIDQEGQMIALVRETAKVADGAGGFSEPSEATVTLPAVKRFLVAVAINVRSGNTREFFQDEEGQRYLIKYVMVGMPGDDIQQNDTFMLGIEKMQVVAVHGDKSYMVRAQIIGVDGGA